MWVLRQTAGTILSQETAVSRISIDVTDQEQKRLKAMAALQGKSIKDFVLARTIGEEALDADLAQLEELLDKRLRNARAGGVSPRSVGDILEQVKQEATGPESRA